MSGSTSLEGIPRGHGEGYARLMIAKRITYTTHVGPHVRNPSSGPRSRVHLSRLSRPMNGNTLDFAFLHICK